MTQTSTTLTASFIPQTNPLSSRAPWLTTSMQVKGSRSSAARGIRGFISMSVKQFNGQRRPATEIIPLAEYLFRYDRGGFWVGASAFDYWRFPFNKYTRWFLDDFLHTRMLYRALHGSNQPYRYVVQDLAMPYESAAEFVDFAHDSFGIYPLWLCPLKEGPRPTFHPTTESGTATS